MVEDRTYLLSRVFSSSRLSESKWLYMHPSEEEDSSESKLLRNGKRALDDDDELRQSKSLKRMGLPIHENDSDSDQQQQQQSDHDSLINDIGRDNSISCLLRCPRSDYGSIASLNQSFRSLVKSRDIYRLRRQNTIVEHWVYFSCQLLEWVAFDPVERRWMNLPTMPSGVTFMCADKESLAVGTDLLVLGKDDDSSHVVYRYSLLTNSWSPGKRMTSPRCLFGSASLGEIAIFAGGCDPLADLSRTYGPIMHLKLGRLNTVIISSPEAAREVLRTHDRTLSGRKSPNAVRPISYHKVSVAWIHPSLARWRLLRKLSVTHLFSAQRVESTKALRMKKVQELVSFMDESSKREEAVDISRASFITTLNIISNILFSVDLGSYGSEKSNGFHDSIIGVMEAAGSPDLANFFPFLEFLNLQGNTKRMKFCTDKLFKVFREFINTKTAEKSLRNDPKDASNRDFLDALLDLTVGEEAELDYNDIEHLLLDMFVAGTNTNSSTLEWAMTELLTNPKTMAKAQAEIEQMIGLNGFVQEPDISELTYIQSVVKETLRLHPPVPFLFPREAETDVEIFGYLVSKDAQVLVNVWAIGRDPGVWENPTQFEPERFLGKEIDVKGKDYELTPFGAGRRICPGLPLAVKMVPLMLVSLLYSFDWKLPNSVDMDETFGVTLHKANPLHAVPVKKNRH